MNLRFYTLVFSSLFLSSFLNLCAQKKIPDSFQTPVKKFFEKYCITCHGEQKAKGEVRLDRLDYTLSSLSGASQWQEILNTLNAGDMPPENEAQPGAEELTGVLSAMTDAIKSARERLSASGGKIVMRHLNRREYAATLEDIFGMRIPLDKLPPDLKSDSFDTNGQSQYFTTFLIDHYLDIGKMFVADAIKCISHKPSKSGIIRIEPEKGALKTARKKLDDMEQKMALVKEGKSWQEIGFDVELSYTNFVKYYDGQHARYNAVVSDERWQTGVFMGRAPTKDLYIGGMLWPGATYKLRARGGNVGSLPGERTLLKVSLESNIFKSLSFNGTYEKPDEVEIEFTTSLDGKHHQHIHINENRINSGFEYGFLRRKFGDEGLKSPVWLDWIEIEGPFYKEKSFFETSIMPVLLQKKPKDEDIKKLIYNFAAKCFRGKKPQPRFIDSLFKIYQENISAGQTPKEAIVEPLGLVLASPGFLYIHEPATAGKQRLGQVEFANRLAYFLWSSPPDKELYYLASQGFLYKTQVLKDTLVRMLESPRSDRFIEGFVEQWAELHKFDELKVDREFYHFKEVTRMSARREMAEYFKHMVKENLPVEKLIDSDFAVIDKVLSTFYDIPGSFDHKFKKVDLPENSPRGGILGMAAFLIMGTNGGKSSPVARGKFILQRFLDYDPPPPPPNVPELDLSSKNMTVREALSKHVSLPQCASCHRKIDPIGFGLENFDPIGRWRDKEKVGRKEFAVNAAGELPDGSAFADVFSLKKALLKHKDSLAGSLYKSLFSYAVGRNIEFTDEAEIASALKALKKRDYPLKEMVLRIVFSKSFQSK